MTEWLSVPDFAAQIGVRDSRVRDLLREHHLIAVRRGENDALALPADFIVEGDHAPHILPTLRGTITVLADAGLSDDQAIEWLLTHNEELGATPLDALRSGVKAPVRRAALALF
jgi:hypothetical protein